MATGVEFQKLWEELEPSYNLFTRKIIEMTPAAHARDLDKRAHVLQMVLGAVMQDLKGIADAQQPAYKAIPMSMFAQKIFPYFVRSCEKQEGRQTIIDNLVKS